MSGLPLKPDLGGIQPNKVGQPDILVPYLRY